MAEPGRLALARRGWGDSDGGFGVVYRTDLDQHDRDFDGVEIPEGNVMLYGFWGPPAGYEFLITESDYISSLLKYLPSSVVSPYSAHLLALQDSINQNL